MAPVLSVKLDSISHLDSPESGPDQSLSISMREMPASFSKTESSTGRLLTSNVPAPVIYLSPVLAFGACSNSADARHDVARSFTSIHSVTSLKERVCRVRSLGL